MKRCHIGLGLLIGLLALGILAAGWLGRCHGDLAEDVKAAAKTAQAGDWQRTRILIGEASESWEKTWGLTAALSDHGPMEQINGLFAQLEPYAEAEEALAFATVCAQLSAELEAMADMQQLSWRNFL